MIGSCAVGCGLGPRTAVWGDDDDDDGDDDDDYDAAAAAAAADADDDNKKYPLVRVTMIESSTVGFLMGPWIRVWYYSLAWW